VPEVEWLEHDIDVSHWKVPMSTTWSYIEKEKRNTPQDQRMQGVLVGHADNSRCYEVFDKVHERVYNRRCGRTS
jgi:hypothetical protein